METLSQKYARLVDDGKLQADPAQEAVMPAIAQEMLNAGLHAMPVAQIRSTQRMQ
jgi:hypothetical protein